MPRFGKHHPHAKGMPRHTIRHFVTLSALSLVLVASMSFVTRAELRISGNVLADLPFASSIARVEEEATKVYEDHTIVFYRATLHRTEGQKAPDEYLIRVYRPDNGEPRIEAAEKLHR